MVRIDYVVSNLGPPRRFAYNQTVRISPTSASLTSAIEQAANCRQFACSLVPIATSRFVVDLRRSRPGSTSTSAANGVNLRTVSSIRFAAPVSTADGVSATGAGPRVGSRSRSVARSAEDDRAHRETRGR